MSERMPGMSVLAKSISKTTLQPGDSERAAIREMVRSAKERGLEITGSSHLRVIDPGVRGLVALG